MTRRTSGAAIAALVVSEGLWGLTFVMIRYATNELPVATLTVLDAGVALVCLNGLLLATGRRVPRPSPRLLACAAMEPGVSYVLLNYGTAHTSGSHASLIGGLQAAMVVLLAAIVIRRRPRVGVGIGLVVATAGTFVLVEHSTGIATLRGDLFVLAGTLASTIYIVFIAPLAATTDALELTAAQFVYGSVLTIPLAAILAWTGALPPFGWAPPSYVIVGAGVGVVGSTLSYGLYNWALGRSSAAVAGISLALIPVFGLFFAITLLGDPMTGRILVAAALVVAGLVITARAEPEIAEHHSPVP